MRKNTLITLGISTAFGALAIVLARGWINDAVTTEYKQTRPAAIRVPAAKLKTVDVVVADTDLNFGDRLSPQNVRIVQYLEDAVPEGSYTNFEQVFSGGESPVVVLKHMRMNEPLLPFKISAPGQRAILSTLIGDNMRAVSIKVNSVSGVSGFIQPADRVDIFLIQAVDMAAKTVQRAVTLEQNARPKANFITTTFLQDVKVLGVDQRPESSDTRVQVSKTVTLEVTPQDAQKLALAMQIGTLSLSLRQPGSKEIIAPSVLRVGDLGGQAPKRKQSTRRSSLATRGASLTKKNPQTSGTASVVVVRGDKSIQVRVFEDANSADDNLAMAGGSL